MRTPRHDAEKVPRKQLVDAPFGRAVLEASAESGYFGLTVQKIVDRAGISRALFYETYANREQCFAVAYAAAVDELARRLLDVCDAEQSWGRGLQAALDELADFIDGDRLLANGVLLQARAAGTQASAKREEVNDRLIRAIDGARSEVSGSPPPPLAAQFVLSGIEAAALSILSAGPRQEFAPWVPDLMYIAVSTFFGSDVAGEGED